MRRRLFVWMLKVLAASALCLPAQAGGGLAQESAGAQQFAALGDFELESGEKIRDCRIGYRTFGQLNDARSNAVLFPTWFSATTENLLGSIGPGKFVDTTHFFVVAADAFGNRVSSSPSNSQVQAGAKFPRFTIRDMVRAQHVLLTRVLGIRHLYAVVGLSMGGMQAFEWVVSYPEFVEKAVPIIGSPRLTSYDRLLWEAEIRPLGAARECRCGEEAAMRAVTAMHNLALTTPAYRARQTPLSDFPRYLAEIDARQKNYNASDWASQLHAISTHDVSARFGSSLEKTVGAVRAKLLVVVATQDHMVSPLPALEFARLLNAPTLELRGDCGHLAVACEAHTLLEALQRFLAPESR